jgi:chorismate synthase
LNVSLSFVSIMSPHRTITRAFDDTEIVTKGCHDPCVGTRAAPVGEAIISCGWRSPVVSAAGGRGGGK